MSMADKTRIANEQIIISSSLKSTKAFMQLLEMNLTKDSFNYPYHRLLFSYAIEYYYNSGEIPKINSLAVHLIKVKADTSLQGYLREDIVKSKSEADIALYLEALISDNIDQEISKELESFKNLKYSGLEYARALSEAASDIISKYQTGNSDIKTNKQTCQTVLENIEKAMKGVQTEYIPTGFKSLDKNIIGIPKKHLSILASRPSMGKTAFSLALLRNFRKQGIRCGVFSLEMESESLWQRNLAAETGINSIKIETGDLTKEEFQKVKRAAADLSTEDYILDDNGHQTPESIKAKINLWKANNQVDVVLIDYLTLIDHNYDEKRNDLNIGKLTSDLRIFAKQSGLPLILICQLNRAVESRPDKRPILSDLRESGSIEQDAKLVMFLHRPSYYGIDPFNGKESPYMTQDGFMLDREEYGEIIIRKARSGRVGTVPFRCILPLHRYEEVKPIGSSNLQESVTAVKEEDIDI